MEEAGFTPGWVLAIQGLIYITVQVISYFKNRSKATADKEEVINKTAHPIQVTNVGADVLEVKNEQANQKKLIQELQQQVAVLATKKDLDCAIEKTETGLQEKVKVAVTDSLTGFARGKALSEKTVIEGDKK